MGPCTDPLLGSMHDPFWALWTTSWLHPLHHHEQQQCSLEPCLFPSPPQQKLKPKAAPMVFIGFDISSVSPSCPPGSSPRSSAEAAPSARSDNPPGHKDRQRVTHPPASQCRGGGLVAAGRFPAWQGSARPPTPPSQHVKPDSGRGNQAFAEPCRRRLLCGGGPVPGPPALSLNLFRDGEAVTAAKIVGLMLHKHHGADGRCLKASLPDLAAAPPPWWQPAARRGNAANPFPTLQLLLGLQLVLL